MLILPRRAILPASVMAALLTMMQLTVVHAQETPDKSASAQGKQDDSKSGKEPAKLETITVTAGAYRDSGKGTASALAPTQASLEATQPQSIITREFIESAVAPTAEYSRVVNVAPSLSGDSANGPGLSETKTTMRGFSDDQYNIDRKSVV